MRDQDQKLADHAAALGHALAGGVDEPLYDATLWRQCEQLLEQMREALAAGADPAPVTRMLAALPPPENRRAQTLALLLRANLLQDGAATTQALDGTAADLASATPSHSLAQADYLLRAVVFGCWSNRLPVADPTAHDMALRRLWQAIMARYRAETPVPPPLPRAERERDLVLVITGQFMQGMHQPSLDILDFLSTLVLRLGRRVVLINTADGPVSAKLPFLGGMVGMADDALQGLDSLSVNRLPVPFRHLPPGFTSPALAASTLAHIRDLRPDMVMAFGTMNPVADLCRDLLDVVAIPFGSYMPLAEPGFLALPRPLTPADGPALAMGGLTPERVIPIQYSYAPPPAQQTRSRADLGIPADAILTLVIGLRLAQEVTPAFAEALDQAIQQEPRLFFLFIGPLAGEDWAARLPSLAARSRRHGYDEDVMSILPLADLYLNPPRLGGGSSAAFALSCAVPAYGLPMGDVATVIGPDFHLSDYSDFASLARRWADDPAWRQAQRLKAKARFNDISSRETMLRSILDGVKARRQP